LYEPRLFHPVLATFVRALPHTYRDVSAAEGTHVRLTISGDAGGAWSVVMHDGRWGLYDGVETPPAATVTLDEETAWRLFTKGVAPGEARARATVEGDAGLGAAAFDVVAIIA
jgi:hypothetical protein